MPRSGQDRLGRRTLTAISRETSNGRTSTSPRRTTRIEERSLHLKVPLTASTPGGVRHGGASASPVRHLRLPRPDVPRHGRVPGRPSASAPSATSTAPTGSSRSPRTRRRRSPTRPGRSVTRRRPPTRPTSRRRRRSPRRAARVMAPPTRPSTARYTSERQGGVPLLPRRERRAVGGQGPRAAPPGPDAQKAASPRLEAERSRGPRRRPRPGPTARRGYFDVPFGFGAGAVGAGAVAPVAWLGPGCAVGTTTIFTVGWNAASRRTSCPCRA